MYDRYMMYTNTSETSAAFGKLRSYLFSFVNRGLDKGGLFSLKSLVIKEKISRYTVPMDCFGLLDNFRNLSVYNYNISF